MPKLLCIAFAINGTGLTRVMSTLIEQLSQKYEIHFLGVGYNGEVTEEENYTLHPTNLNGGDIMGAYAAKELIYTLSPDSVFILHDAWHFQRYMQVFEDVRHLSQFVAYVPIDGAIVDPQSISSLLKLDVVVLYTEWAHEQVREAMLKIATPDTLPRLEVIGHGVDTESFFPIKDKKANRKAVFPHCSEESFIFLNASRPCIRKRIDLTLIAFAAFSRNKPNSVKLCLHQAIKEEQSNYLQELIETLDLTSRVILNPLKAETGSVLDDKDLNRLYNACDVGINSSMGEGWGLVSFEHAATGAAQIVPRHTACEELWQGHAITIACEESKIGQLSPFAMTQTDVEQLTQAFEDLYSDTIMRESIAHKCQKVSNSREYTWESIGQEWLTLFSQLQAPQDLASMSH